MHMGGYGGVGGGIDDPNDTSELCYSTKPIQRVAVSFCWTAKVINRAINKQNEGKQ